MPDAEPLITLRLTLSTPETIEPDEITRRVGLTPSSTWHVGEQPSHGVLLPSSHCSPPSSVPFPHTAPCAHAGSVGVRQPGCGAQSRVGAMLAEPSTIGGFDGSRYSRRLWPEGFELSCPPIVIWALAWSRFSPSVSTAAEARR